MKRSKVAFELACCALCMKQDIPQVEAVIRLLEPSLRFHWQAIGSDIYERLLARLDEVDTLLSDEDIRRIQNNPDSQAREDAIVAILASLMLIVDHRAITPIPDRTQETIANAVDTILDAEDENGDLFLAFPLLRLGAIAELTAMLEFTVQTRRDEIEALLDEYLRNPDVRNRGASALPARPRSAIDVPRNREEFEDALQGSTGDKKTVPARVNSTVDQWALRWHVAAQVSAIAQDEGPRFRLVVFNNPPTGPDTKTTAFCAWVHGQTLSISRALQQIKRQVELALEGDVPGLIENWPLLSRKAAQEGTVEEFTAFFKANGLPGYHHGCRTQAIRVSS